MSISAAEYRQRRQGREITGAISLPSGAQFTMRRPPLDLWIAAGKIPQSFLKAMLEAQQGGASAAVRFSVEETLDGYSFLTEAIIYAAVEPRLSLDGAGDTLRLDELDPADFRFLVGWVQAGSPGVPVATEKGQVEPDRLTRFRQKRPGGSTDASTDSAEVRESPEHVIAVG